MKLLSACLGTNERKEKHECICVSNICYFVFRGAMYNTWKHDGNLSGLAILVFSRWSSHALCVGQWWLHQYRQCGAGAEWLWALRINKEFLDLKLMILESQNLSKLSLLVLIFLQRVREGVINHHVCNTSKKHIRRDLK